MTLNPKEVKIIVKCEEEDLIDTPPEPRCKQKAYNPYITMKKGALVMMSGYKKGHGSDLLQEKQQDKEIAWKDIQPKDRRLYEKAEQDQWDEWVDNGSVKVHGPEEAKKIRCTVSNEKILKSVYRDKIASIRTPQRFVPVKAKARLAVGGQNCPGCAAGKIRTDAPTV